VRALWNLEKIIWVVRSLDNLKSTSLTHSGEFVMLPLKALFDVPFIFTMALKALEELHLHQLTGSIPHHHYIQEHIKWL
jgi:hypothetical protein